MSLLFNIYILYVFACTTNYVVTVKAKNLFNDCWDVIPDPDSQELVRDIDCARCNYRSGITWPCNKYGVCMCSDQSKNPWRKPKPADPNSPFANCPKVIPDPNTPQKVDESQCAQCNDGKVTYWPCNMPGVCMCEGSKPNPKPDPKPDPPPNSDSPFANCAKVIPDPNTPQKVTESDCAQCNNGKVTYWPCNMPGVCMCEGSQPDPKPDPPPNPDSPFANCPKVIPDPNTPQKVTESDCAQCNNGKVTYWPCNVPRVCMCASK